MENLKNKWKELPKAAKVIVVAGVLLFLFSMAAKAQELTLAQMNNHIDQTNFIVGNHCSATLISVEERLLLTNQHCVDQYISERSRQVISGDGEISNVKYEFLDIVPVSQKVYNRHEVVSSLSYSTEIVAYSKEVDLAILRFRADTIPNTTSSRVYNGEGVERGETVYAVGNPLGLDATLTKGIISSTNRRLEVGGEERDYFQMDAGIAGGNSGGALYNTKGELIGVPAAAASGTMIGLSIPAVDVVEFLEANCYASVVDPAEKSYVDCVKEKEAEEKE